MSQTLEFDAALDAAEKLDPESQVTLIDVLRRRLAERGRQRLIESVAEGRAEFAAGKCKPTTAADLIREAMS